MTKTPEQMAEEWASSRWYAKHDPTVSGESKVAFLAGYKAGQEHPFQFQAKMWVDPIGPQDRWISVKESEPSDETWVLGTNGREIECVFKHFTDCYSMTTITHWMPLPAAPKEEV